MSQDSQTKILQLHADQKIDLAAMGSWEASKYLLGSEHVGAIQAAFFSGRPLLVRGDPGLGKSRLAQALASYLEWGLVATVIHYNTVIDDLLFSIDHLERLHMANRPNSSAAKLAIRHFIRPGVVWQALAPATLPNQQNTPHGKAGTVLLIDEIDKADSSLPNALLEVLDNRAISCPHRSEPIRQTHPLMVVITSNDERLLPMAFIRRCATLDLQLPDKEADGICQLKKIYRAHYPTRKAGLPHYIGNIAKMIVKQRDTTQGGEYRPGTSEFLDVIKALEAYKEEERDEKLQLLAPHLIQKYQQRP